MAIILAIVRFFSATYSLHLFTITQHGQPILITNPAINITPQDSLLIIIHGLPIVILILKPELILT